MKPNQAAAAATAAWLPIYLYGYPRVAAWYINQAAAAAWLPDLSNAFVLAVAALFVYVFIDVSLYCAIKYKRHNKYILVGVIFFIFYLLS